MCFSMHDGTDVNNLHVEQILVGWDILVRSLRNIKLQPPMPTGLIPLELALSSRSPFSPISSEDNYPLHLFVLCHCRETCCNTLSTNMHLSAPYHTIVYFQMCQSGEDCYSNLRDHTQCYFHPESYAPPRALV